MAYLKCTERVLRLLASAFQPPNHLLTHVLKMKPRRPRHRTLRQPGQPLPPLPLLPITPNNHTGLPPLLHRHNLHSHTPRRPLQPLDHLPERTHLIKGQLTLKHRLRRLAPIEPSLQRLHKRHGLFHLTHLRDLRRQRFVVEGDAVEGGTGEVDVFLLPGGKGGGGEDGEFFGAFGVEGDGFAFVFAFLLRGFGGGDGGGGGADVVSGGCEGGVGWGHLRPEGGLDGGGVVEDFLPDVVGPVGGDGGKEEGLQADVLVDEGVVHAGGGGGGGFAVEVAGGGEVVEGGFEGEFVVCAGWGG